MIMGAIWEFLSGKSTDWDELEALEAERTRKQLEYEAAHPEIRAARMREREMERERARERNKKYVAYCKYCGEHGFARSTPEEAIQDLQYCNVRCGRHNHTPEIREIY